MARIQATECLRDGCRHKPHARDLCKQHYREAMGIRSKSSTPSRNATATLRRGRSPQPPRSLPYRALAATCRQCGDLITTPDDMLHRDVPGPECKRCRVRAVAASKKKRMARDDEYRVTERRRTDRKRSSANTQLRASASRHGLEWTGPEMAVADRTDLTHRQVAAMLGRSLYAVRSVRRRLQREEPRYVALASD